MFKTFIEKFLKEYHNGDLLNLAIICGSIIIGSIILHFIIFRALKLLNKKDSFVIKQTRDLLRKPSLAFLIVLDYIIIVHLFTPEGVLTSYIMHALKLCIIFSITWLLLRLTTLGRDTVLSKYNISEKDNLKARRVYTQFKIIQRILNFVIILIAVATALMTFEGIRQVGAGLFASAGVAGIILGFAAQRMIGTVLAGFQIAITQPIRLEDVVIVEGEWGWIEEITLTYVVIRIWDKRRLVVPSNYFIEKPFQNWTRVSADILGTVFIYTDYTVPFDELRKELTRILKEDDNWDGNVNVLQVTDSTEKTVEIRALVSAVDSPTAWDLRVAVREKLIVYLQNNYPNSLPKTRLTLDKEIEPAIK